MTKPVVPPITDEECQEMLAEYLRKCRTSISDCFDYSSHPKFPTLNDIPLRVCGARLIKTSLDVMKSLKTAKSQADMPAATAAQSGPEKIEN